MCQSATLGSTPSLTRRSDPLIRRASEEVVLDGSTLAQKFRSQKRMRSMPDMRQENRHDDVQIHPKDQAYLHTLHEALIRRRGDSEVFDENSVIPEKALDTWGAGGSWHVYCMLPLVPCEPGFTTRPMMVCPNLMDADKFLARQEVGAINTKGQKGNNPAVGQDACSLSRLKDGWEVFCLMDGHGYDGHWPAQHSCRTMPYVLQNNTGCWTMLKQGQVSAALLHAFDKVQANLVYESLAKDVELQVAGCTALCILKHESEPRVWVATAGDTRALLLVPGHGVVAQTIDHKPNIEGEKERLEQMGCEVTFIQHEDGFVEERVNLKGQDFPGLCMSRSLGDLAVKDNGVTHSPTIVEWGFQDKDQAYILAASDGVWEFLKSETVAHMVLNALERGMTCQEVVESLMRKSRETWRENEDDYCDDITIILSPLRTKDEAARARLNHGSTCSACCGSGLCSLSSLFNGKNKRPEKVAKS